MSAFNYTGKEELQNNEVMVGYNRHIASIFASCIGLGDRIADFGAGMGTISALVREQTGLSPICIDLDPVHRELLGQRGFQVVTDLNEIDGALNTIYSSNVLEHIDDDEAILRCIYDKLAPRGCFVTYVPAFRCLWTKLDERVGHVRRYRAAEIKQKLQAAGFVVERVYYQDSIGFFLALLFRVIGDKEGKVNVVSLRLFDRWLFPISKLLDPLTSHFFGKNLVAIARKG